jgi:hypothetical protein
MSHAHTTRPTGLSSPAYQDWLDYIVLEDGHAIGRMYEDRHAKAELRWFWSITVYVNPKHGIITRGRTATLEEAKAKFLASWRKCRTADSTPPGRTSIVAFAYQGQEQGSAPHLERRPHPQPRSVSRPRRGARPQGRRDDRHPPVRARRFSQPAAAPARARLKQKSPSCDSGGLR